MNRVRYIVAALVLSVLVLPIEIARGDCFDISAMYSRNITSTGWTWTFDEQSINGAHYANPPGTPISASQVKEFIRTAVQQWTTTVNSAGTVLTMTETSGSAQLTIRFVAYDDAYPCADAPDNTSMLLNKSRNWASSGSLSTTILHEMGHVFLGSGHHNGSGVMNCSYGNDCDLTGGVISAAEAARVLSLYNPNVTLNIKNVFGDGSGGGQMMVGSETIDLQSTGYTQVARRTSQFPLTLTAVINQTSGGFPQDFIKWTGSNPSSNSSITISTGGSFDATFKDRYAVTVHTSGPVGSFAGTVRINNGQPVIAPTTVQVQQDDSVLVDAVIAEQIVAALKNTFTNWTPGNHATLSHWYKPTRSSYTFTANFSTKPVPVSNLITGDSVGSPVQVSWSEHPNENVNHYKIWRQVKHNGVVGPEYNIASVNRGTTSYTDYSYLMTNGYTHDLVWYDARAHLSINDSYADPQWYANYAQPDNGAGPQLAGGTDSERPPSFSMTAYPNPFNPVTTIRYALPAEVDVVLRVYTTLGQLVTTLVDEEQTAGYKSVALDGVGWASGIYIVRIKAGSFTAVRKILLTR